MLNAVHEGRLSLDRLVELLYDGPRQIYCLPEQPETTIYVDLKERHTLSNRGLQTKCGWTPFSGMTVTGRLQSVTLRGQRVFERTPTPQFAAPTAALVKEES
jgi:carbamoyl-phosphate synthase/aspartate carbamoyltransferase/dihydroorotase